MTPPAKPDRPEKVVVSEVVLGEDGSRTMTNVIRPDRPEEATTARTWVLLVKPNGEAAPHYCHDDSYCRNRQTHEHVPVVEQAAMDDWKEVAEIRRTERNELEGHVLRLQDKLAAETQRADQAEVSAMRFSSNLAIARTERDRLAKRVEEFTALLGDAVWTIVNEHRTEQHQQCDLGVVDAIRSVLTANIVGGVKP